MFKHAWIINICGRVIQGDGALTVLGLSHVAYHLNHQSIGES